MINVNAIGYRNIALPVVVIATKFFAVPIKDYDPNYTLEEERQQLLQDSIFKSKQAILHPDEIEIETKQRKLSSLMEYAASLLAYQTGDRDITVARNLPVPNPPNMNVQRRDTSLELNITLWEAERVRNRYVVLADQARPQYEFRSNKGEPTRRHYKILFERGPCRVHHSITPYGLAKYVYDLACKKDPDLEYFYEYVKKPPRWWYDYTDYHIQDFYTQQELDKIYNMKKTLRNTRRRRKCLKDTKTYDLLKSKKYNREPPKEVQDWIKENEPEDFDLPFL